MLFLVFYMKKHISVITPCYNEEGNVRLLIETIGKIFEKLPQYTYEHVLIDNCSTDKTPEILKDITTNNKNVKVIFTEVGLKEYYEGQSLKPEIEEFLFKLGFEELPGGFEINGFEYEGNNIYIRK